MTTQVTIAFKSGERLYLTLYPETSHEFYEFRDGNLRVKQEKETIVVPMVNVSYVKILTEGGE